MINPGVYVVSINFEAKIVTAKSFFCFPSFFVAHHTSIFCPYVFFFLFSFFPLLFSPFSFFVLLLFSLLVPFLHFWKASKFVLKSSPCPPPPGGGGIRNFRLQVQVTRFYLRELSMSIVWKCKKNSLRFSSGRNFYVAAGRCFFQISGQSVPISCHSQTCAKSAHLVTLETKMNNPSKYYHTYKPINN